MEYQKIVNLWDNTPSQPTKFRAKNWVDINGDSRQTCNTHTQTKFKTSMLGLVLYVYNDSYILVSETIIVPNKGEAANPNNRKKW